MLILLFAVLALTRRRRGPGFFPPGQPAVHLFSRFRSYCGHILSCSLSVHTASCSLTPLPSSEWYFGRKSRSDQGPLDRAEQRPCPGSLPGCARDTPAEGSGRVSSRSRAPRASGRVLYTAECPPQALLRLSTLRLLPSSLEKTPVYPNRRMTHRRRAEGRGPASSHLPSQRGSRARAARRPRQRCGPRCRQPTSPQRRLEHTHRTAF